MSSSEFNPPPDLLQYLIKASRRLTDSAGGYSPKLDPLIHQAGAAGDAARTIGTIIGSSQGVPIIGSAPSLKEGQSSEGKENLP